MLILQNIFYSHPNKDLLFSNLSLTVANHEKTALIGNNGSGKSTLLKIIAGELKPSAGQRIVDAKPYYVPQLFGQYDHLTVAQALRIETKLNALTAILNGNVSEENYSLLEEDWTIEERCNTALQYWQVAGVKLNQAIGTLSGGQKAKVFLAGLSIHQPELILLDEPSNHLDLSGRQLLQDFIQSCTGSLVMVSHDRQLLNCLDTVCELGKHGVVNYGGNYDFYVQQKQIAKRALYLDLQTKEKSLRKAKEKERDTLERQQRLDSRGKGKQEKAGVAKIMMNTLRNKAENSTAKLKDVHAEKIDDISRELLELRNSLPDLDTMKFGFDTSDLHKGKILFTADAINFSYGDDWLWKEPLTLQVVSGQRLALKGANGSGKTTLIKIILGEAWPEKGKVYRAEMKSVYIDQDYSVIDDLLTVYEQAQQFNSGGLQEHEIKTRLARFLFGKEEWDKNCGVLSGGEKMRLILCCLTISNRSPDIIILDEPTNNLDIQNIEILTAAINGYQGTLIVISHDEYFLKQIKIEQTFQL